jgi:hypothetical protein
LGGDYFVKAFLQTLGVIASIGLFIWADKLTEPIKNKSFDSLSEEMVKSIGSAFAGIFKEAFDQPYEIYSKSYDAFWNLALPSLLFLLVAVVLGYFGYDMAKSIMTKQEHLLDLILKGILGVCFAIFSVVIFIQGAKLFLINLGVNLIGLFVFGIIVLGFISLLNNSESRTR